jgi:hypothetical protein
MDQRLYDIGMSIVALLEAAEEWRDEKNGCYEDLLGGW